MPSPPLDAVGGAQPLTRIRALMADEDPDERLRLAAVLARSGLEVIAVASGADVLNAVSAWEPNVVVVTWPLRGGGLELVRELVEERGMVGRVILISAFADLRDEQAAREAGATHYFTRPADPDRLIDAIRHAAQTRQ